LLSPGAQGYRAKRKGERKRRSVRGCIVGPDIKMLSLSVVKKGDKEIPGCTDTVKPRRLGPKRATGIRKLFGIEKGEKALESSVPLIKKHVIRRTFKSKKNPNAPQRNKAPKIQRLVTENRLRRKRIQKADKIKKWKRSIAQAKEYKELHDTWANKKRNDLKVKRKASREEKPKEEPKKAPVKPVK
jgi:small subunit ribosomal protein S6e